MSAIDYETALGFVISLRPRMAVEDADAAARRLMTIGDPVLGALDSKDFGSVALMSPLVMDAVRADKKILAVKELRGLIMRHHGPHAPNGGSWLREAKEAVEERRVAVNFPPRSSSHPDHMRSF